LALAGARSGSAQQAPPDQPEPERPFSERVESAIDRGCAWLKQQQGIEDGEDPAVFGVFPAMPPAYAAGDPVRYRIARTAFPVQALCTAGVFHDAPEIRKAMDYLRKTYVEEGTIKCDPKFEIPLTYEDATVLCAVEAYYIGAWEARERGLGSPSQRFVKDGNGKFIKDDKGEKVPILRWGTPEKGALKSKKKRKLSMDARDLQMCELAVRALETRFRNGVYEGGGWRYQKTGVGMNDPQIDVSATQYAILGLKCASRLGLRYDKAMLLQSFRFLKAQQDQQGPEVQQRWKLRESDDEKSKRRTSARDESEPPAKLFARGWAYARQSSRDANDRMTYGSMTAAGVNALIVIRDELVDAAAYRKVWDDHEAECNQMIGDGLAWLIKNWTMTNNPSRGPSRFYYYLYSMERLAMLGGIDQIGGHDWYDEGAKVLLKQQQDNGMWDPQHEIDPSEVYNTCYALLFLKCATESIASPAPVITGHAR
jgi:hypothetical protein